MEKIKKNEKGNKMIWELKKFQELITSTQCQINGKWVPSRPINYKYRSPFEKLTDAWAVFTGKAEVVRFPEGQ